MGMGETQVTVFCRIVSKKEDGNSEPLFSSKQDRNTLYCRQKKCNTALEFLILFRSEEPTLRVRKKSFPLSLLPKAKSESVFSADLFFLARLKSDGCLKGRRGGGDEERLLSSGAKTPLSSFYAGVLFCYRQISLILLVLHAQKLALRNCAIAWCDAMC